jgi:2-polyprenyl-6-hydroxyphenyl methylase/3-demethylubiquinone-9 3-methyltransferase
MNGLKEVSAHYEFGDNWRAFAENLTPVAVDQAVEGMRQLVREDEIVGRDVLDIGCGSGLHALAALRLGAASVTAIDIDPNSVATAQDVLRRYAEPGARWSVAVKSVFEIEDMAEFPVVYSWGVLHHTGDMYDAIRRAAARVASGGHLYLALYRKTPMCRLWRFEKWLYTNAPRVGRMVLETGYMTSFRFAMMLKGRDFQDYVSAYGKNRGMAWRTDVRDWLGGYPYESITEDEMLRFAAELGLAPVRRFCRKPGFGLFGTGCDEYAFRKPIGAG